MYADKDSRGLVSVFEMNRPEWSALRGACNIAIKLWEVQLSEFDGRPVNELHTWELQRKCLLEQNIEAAGKLAREITRADARIAYDTLKGAFGKQNDGDALDIFNL